MDRQGGMNKRKRSTDEDGDRRQRPYSPYIGTITRPSFPPLLEDFNLPTSAQPLNLNPPGSPASSSAPSTFLPPTFLPPNPFECSNANPMEHTLSTNEQQVLLLTDEDARLVDFPSAPPTASGGFCELYIAVFWPKNLKLAMRRLKADFPTDDMLRRFRREAGMWSTFKHAHILPFFGTMNINHRIYLVSPWMSLGDLLAFIQARIKLIEQGKDLSDGSINLAYAKFNEVRIIREIAAGLEYLHSMEVTHGDMKAKNVLLNDQGCAQICDFGLTKTLDHAATSTELKGVGSIRWQSPELLENVPKSPMSDVYAFGMTIAEILTGDYPFPHLKEQTAVLRAIVIRNERPKPEPSFRLSVDFAPLWKLAATCWKTEVTDRPLVKEALQELELLELFGSEYIWSGSTDLHVAARTICPTVLTRHIKFPAHLMQTAVAMAANWNSIGGSNYSSTQQQRLHTDPPPIPQNSKDGWSGCISWTYRDPKFPHDPKEVLSWVTARCNIPSSGAQIPPWPKKLVFNNSHLQTCDSHALAQTIKSNSFAVWAFSPHPNAPINDEVPSESVFTMIITQLGPKKLGTAVFIPVVGAPVWYAMFLFATSSAGANKIPDKLLAIAFPMGVPMLNPPPVSVPATITQVAPYSGSNSTEDTKPDLATTSLDMSGMPSTPDFIGNPDFISQTPRLGIITPQISAMNYQRRAQLPAVEGQHTPQQFQRQPGYQQLAQAQRGALDQKQQARQQTSSQFRTAPQQGQTQNQALNGVSGGASSSGIGGGGEHTDTRGHSRGAGMATELTTFLRSQPAASAMPATPRPTTGFHQYHIQHPRSGADDQSHGNMLLMGLGSRNTPGPTGLDMSLLNGGLPHGMGGASAALPLGELPGLLPTPGAEGGDLDLWGMLFPETRASGAMT